MDERRRGDGVRIAVVLPFYKSKDHVLEVIAGIGPWKDALLLRRALDPAPADPLAARRQLTGQVHPLAHTARTLGLAVHPYTLRAEPPFLSLDEDGRTMTMADEIQRLLGLGATGLFTDHPGATREALGR